MKKKKINLSHNLMGCRFDNWMRLKNSNPIIFVCYSSCGKATPSSTTSFQISFAACISFSLNSLTFMLIITPSVKLYIKKRNAVHSVKKINYSATNGNSAIILARLIAVVSCLWCFAQLPLIRLGTILPLSVTYLLSFAVSL